MAWDPAPSLVGAPAAAARVLLPLFLPALTMIAIGLSAALWCAALLVYVVRYAAVLTRARLDGKPG